MNVYAGCSDVAGCSGLKGSRGGSIHARSNPLLSTYVHSRHRCFRVSAGKLHYLGQKSPVSQIEDLQSQIGENPFNHILPLLAILASKIPRPESPSFHRSTYSRLLPLKSFCELCANLHNFAQICTQGSVQRDPPPQTDLRLSGYLSQNNYNVFLSRIGERILQ
jgi:hypothetical protein